MLFFSYFFLTPSVLGAHVQSSPAAIFNGVASVGFGFIFLPLTNDWQREAGAVSQKEDHNRSDQTKSKTAETAAKTHQLKVLMAIIMIC